MVCAEISSRLACVQCFMIKADIPRPLTRSQRVTGTRLAMVDRARKKKRPEQQPRPDCSVAQLTLGTPLPLLAAQSERPVKI